MIRLLLALALGASLMSCAGTVAAPLAPPDRDADAVVDASDACPDEPEDRDGHEDDDGCPDPDDDHDGVSDAVDSCPNDAEDIDAYQDRDGCPEPDNDGDRILDVDDDCPCVAENYNGYEDDDGCPDRGYVLLERGRLLILDRVYFARGSARVSEQSRPILEAVAAVIVNNPVLRVIEVSGHTSPDEPRASVLGAARAQAVRDALVALGVEASRVPTRAFGAERPRVDGRSREANEANRRVEFDILESDESEDSAPPPPPEPIPNCPEP